MFKPIPKHLCETQDPGAPLFIPPLIGVVLNNEIEIIVALVTLVLCFFQPRWYLREIWKGSDPELIDKEGLRWKKSAGGGLVTLWWVFRLLFPISLLIPAIYELNKIQDYDRPLETEVLMNPQVWFIPMVMLGLSTLLTMLMIAMINIRQKSRFQNIIKVWEE